MRGVPDRFERLGFRINVPDWMSLELRADRMIGVIARGDDLVDITFLVEEKANEVRIEFSRFGEFFTHYVADIHPRIASACTSGFAGSRFAPPMRA
jgi:hypothetical protein